MPVTIQVENPGDPPVYSPPAFPFPITPQPTLRDCLTGCVGVSGRARDGGLECRVFLARQDISYPWLPLLLWQLDMPPDSCICTPPSKLHPRSCELSADFLPSLPYHICFSPSCVWKNSSVFLLIITFLWTVFLVVISTASSQITAFCHNDQSLTRPRVWLCRVRGPRCVWMLCVYIWNKQKR